MKPRGTPFRRALQPAIPRVPGAGKPGQLLTVPRTSGANRRHGQPAAVTKSAVGPPLLFALLLSISFAAALLAGCDPAPLPPELDEARKGTIQALVDEVSLTELMAILEDLNGSAVTSRRREIRFPSMRTGSPNASKRAAIR
jgi:hypothetical protein